MKESYGRGSYVSTPRTHFDEKAGSSDTCGKPVDNLGEGLGIPQGLEGCGSVISLCSEPGDT